MPLEFFRIGPVVSEIRGGGARNSPPSGARYKNTPVGRGLNAYNLQTMSFLADIYSNVHGNRRVWNWTPWQWRSQGGHSPQRPITGDQHIFCPPNRSRASWTRLGPIAEVDFLSGFRALRDGSGPAGRIRALQNEPGPRGMDPQDESGPRKTDQIFLSSLS